MYGDLLMADCTSVLVSEILCLLMMTTKCGDVCVKDVYDDAR